MPVLWDTKTNCIVNNESSEIIRMLNSDFNNLASNPKLDLYPEALQGAIDAVNEWIYPVRNAKRFTFYGTPLIRRPLTTACTAAVLPRHKRPTTQPSSTNAVLHHRVWWS